MQLTETFILEKPPMRRIAESNNHIPWTIVRVNENAIYNILCHMLR